MTGCVEKHLDVLDDRVTPCGPARKRIHLHRLHRVLGGIDGQSDRRPRQWLTCGIETGD